MWRRILIGLGLLAVLAVAIAGVRFYLRSGSGEASAPIDAPELSTSEVEGDLFRLDPEASEVRFKIDELLFGDDKTVVGRTQEVAGDIVVKPENLAESQVGVIRINVRTLRTDDQFRNRAIRADILESSKDEYEFAEFAPTSVEASAQTLTEGEPVSVNLTGDLKLRDTVSPVTFLGEVTLESPTRLSGSASTTIQRADFNLTIPDAKGVAEVSEEVLLEIDFEADRVEE